MSDIFKVKDKVFSGKTHIMGIVNATPDSFYIGSRIGDDLCVRVKKMIDDGAEIIDIGGQSTAPNSKPISILEETSRILPVVEELRNNFPEIVLSVDTFYSEVARACLDVGVDMINDTSCLKDNDMAKAVGEYNASICIMHNRRNSKVKDMWLDKESGLLMATNKALEYIEEDKILLDGGIGFNLTKEEDIALLNDYDRLSFLGYPLLLGTSRKSFLGGEVETRLSATLDTTRLAVKKGILFVRVHDVKENKMMIDITNK